MSIDKKASALAYRERTKDKAAEYREKNREKLNAYSREYYAANKDAMIASAKEWKLLNKDKVAVSRKKYRLKNPLFHKRWRDKNAARVVYLHAARRASQKQATPKWANNDAMEEFYKLAKKMNAEIGVSHHVDHVVPLQNKIVCGLHCEYNLRVITETENKRKKNSYWPDMPEKEGGWL